MNQLSIEQRLDNKVANVKTLAINYEVTDTYGGEANYSWVKRGAIIANPTVSDLAIVRRIKKEIGWNGVKCRTEDYGDMIALRPRGMAQVCFITYENVPE